MRVLRISDLGMIEMTGGEIKAFCLWVLEKWDWTDFAFVIIGKEDQREGRKEHFLWRAEKIASI